MGLRGEYALHHSGFEPFLFAPLWQEANGSVLSVLSALARLGMDPWKQAALLAQKPPKEAAAALIAMLERLPDAAQAASTRTELAERAVCLLRAPIERAAKPQPRDGGRSFLATHANLLIALAGVAVILLSQTWPS